MFNLVVRSVDSWESGRATMPIPRIFEFTTPDLSREFSHTRVIDFEKLARYPCLFMEEGFGDEVARIGMIVKMRVVGDEIHFDYTLDSKSPPINNRFIYENRAALGIEDFEFSRNHWAVKEIDLYRFLLHRSSSRRQRPTVFKIPEHESIDPKLVSAMMPFSGSFNSVYASIRSVAVDLGLDCRRADDFWQNPAIIQDVVTLIDRSRVVICDCSGRNPNVFYEAGIAHSLGRDVILITQSGSDIPFDLQHLRYIKYLDNSEGREVLSKALRDRMQTILQSYNR